MCLVNNCGKHVSCHLQSSTRQHGEVMVVDLAPQAATATAGGQPQQELDVMVALQNTSPSEPGPEAMTKPEDVPLPAILKAKLYSEPELEPIVEPEAPQARGDSDSDSESDSPALAVAGSGPPRTTAGLVRLPTRRSGHVGPHVEVRTNLPVTVDS
jgi:hypothetical protein